MKRKWLVCVVLVLTIGCSVWGDEYRAFTSKDGRSIEAQIVEYDGKKGRIKIERRGGKALWISPSVFRDGDQEYINAWIQASIFRSTAYVRGSIKQVNDGDTVYYELTLRNQSDTSLNQLEVEYLCRMRIYGSADKLIRYRYVGGRVGIDSLAAGDSTTVSTEIASVGDTEAAVRYLNSSGETVARSSMRLYSEKPSGVWFRVLGPSHEGESLARHFSAPKELMENEEWIPPENALKESILRVQSLVDKDYQERRRKQRSTGKSVDTDLSILASKNNREVRKLSGMVKIGVNQDEALEIHEALILLYLMGVSGGVGTSYSGVGMYDMGLIEEAMFWLDLSCEINRRNSGPYYLAEIYSASSRKELLDGAKALEVLKRRKPHEYFHYAVWARAYARNNQFDLAIEMQKKAIEAHPNYYRCQCPERLEALKKQLEMYERGEVYVHKEGVTPLWNDPCVIGHGY